MCDKGALGVSVGSKNRVGWGWGGAKKRKKNTKKKKQKKNNNNNNKPSLGL